MCVKKAHITANCCIDEISPSISPTLPPRADSSEVKGREVSSENNKAPSWATFRSRLKCNLITLLAIVCLVCRCEKPNRILQLVLSSFPFACCLCYVWCNARESILVNNVCDEITNYQQWMAISTAHVQLFLKVESKDEPPILLQIKIETWAEIDCKKATKRTNE